MLSRSNARAWLAGTALSLSLSLGAHAAGNPADGEKKFYTCYGCHGVIDYNAMRIRTTACRNCVTRTASYLVTALQEYKTGLRPHATMHAQAESLCDQDIEDIAAYLQGPQPVKPSAAVKGSVPKQVAACVACHGENGIGVDAPLTPKPAVLAGQHADYLEQALDRVSQRQAQERGNGLRWRRC